MTRTIGVRALLTALLPLLTGFSGSPPAKQELIVYTYDSFSAQGGLGEWVAAEFEKRTGWKTRYVAFDTAGEALNQVQLEGEATRADVLLGVDEALLPRAHRTGSFVPGNQELLRDIPGELQFDRTGQFVPFDYGYVSLVFDRTRAPVTTETVSFRKLLADPRFSKLVIQDPRTSSLGLSFLAWTHLAFPEKEVPELWRTLSKKVVTVSPGWSGAYGMFLNGEAQYVVSYTTSPAYHFKEDPNSPVRSFRFTEGHYRQTEGAAILRASSRQEVASRWIGFLLSPEAQRALPERQWMYPVRKGVELPASFQKLPPVTKVVNSAGDSLDAKREGWIRDWTHGMSGIK